MSSKCTAAKAYDILGIYDFPDNFDALNGLHSYLYTNGDIVAVGFDPETGESRSLTDGELSRVEGYFTVISEPGSGEKAVDAIRHGMEPCGYDISVETHDMASGKDALLADAPQRDAPAKDTQNIG